MLVGIVFLLNIKQSTKTKKHCILRMDIIIQFKKKQQIFNDNVIEEMLMSRSRYH